MSPRRAGLLILTAGSLSFLSLPATAAPPRKPVKPAPKSAPRPPVVKTSPNQRLIQAAQAGDTAKVTQLLNAGASPNAKDAAKMPVLILTAMGGHSAVMKVLLEKGADPKLAGPDGMTALFAAAFVGKPEDLTLLLDHGAELDARSDDGQTALFSAASNVENLKVLLLRGADPNAATPSGGTTLSMLCDLGDTDTPFLDAVKLLVEKGADVNGKSKSVEVPTPLQAASKQGNLEVVKFLLKSNADVNRAGAGKMTPLMTAAYFARLEVARELVTAGADVKAVGMNGATALLLAFAATPGGERPDPLERKRREQIAQLLLEKGADVNGRIAPDQVTLLMIAAASGDASLVKSLLGKGADPLLRAADGTTALQAATKGKHTEVIRLLKAAGAK